MCVEHVHVSLPVHSTHTYIYDVMPLAHLIMAYTECPQSTLTRQVHVCVDKAWVVGVCISALYVYGPPLTSGADDNTDSGGNDAILSQNVYGELVILMSLGGLE